jgi:hypothetical protein
MHKLAVLSIALVALLADGPASAQEKVDENKTQELKTVDPVPPATGKSLPDQAGTQEPSTKGKGATGNADAFVNGALAVAGAATDGQTVPSKYSTRNAAIDKLPIAAFRLQHLTDAQKHEIYDQLHGGSGALALSPAHAMVGAEIPADIALRDMRPTPERLSAKFPELHGTGYLIEGSNALLVTTNNVVIGVLSGR